MEPIGDGDFRMLDLQGKSPLCFLPQNGIFKPNYSFICFEPFGKKADTLRQLAMALLERTK